MERIPSCSSPCFSVTSCLILLLDLVHAVIVLNTILIRILIVIIINISIMRNSISIIIRNTIIISVSGITGSCCKWRRYF